MKDDGINEQEKDVRTTSPTVSEQEKDVKFTASTISEKEKDVKPTTQMRSTTSLNKSQADELKKGYV